MILSALFAASILLAETTPAAAAAAAAPAPAAATAKTAAAAAEKPKMICRTDPVTGSMFPKKTCYDAKDYALRQQDERKNLQQLQNNLGLRTN